jgi:hypothetical protein
MKPEEKLVWKLIDRDITTEEFEKLQESFSTSKELRQYYQQCIETHTVLSSCTNPDLDTLSFPKPEKEKRTNPPAWLGWAAAALLFAYFGLAPDKPSQVKISASDAPDWRGTELSLGDRVPHHLLFLRDGKIEMNFPSQTTVQVAGPAHFQVIDNQTLEVMDGNIEIAHRGKPGSFTLLSPIGELRDLGTRFTVNIQNVDKQTTMLTEVKEGKVEFKNRKPAQKRILSEGERFLISGTHRGAPAEFRPWPEQEEDMTDSQKDLPKFDEPESIALPSPKFTALDVMLQGNLKAQMKYSMIDSVAQALDQKARILEDAEKAFSSQHDISFAEAAMPEIEAMAHAVVDGFVDFSKLSFWTTCQTAKLSWHEYKDKSGKVTHRTPYVENLKVPEEGNRILVNLKQIKTWLKLVHQLHQEKGMGWVSSFGCPEDGKLIYLRRENDLAFLSQTIASIEQNLD